MQTTPNGGKPSQRSAGISPVRDRDPPPLKLLLHFTTFWEAGAKFFPRAREFVNAVVIRESAGPLGFLFARPAVLMMHSPLHFLSESHLLQSGGLVVACIAFCLNDRGRTLIRYAHARSKRLSGVAGVRVSGAAHPILVRTRSSRMAMSGAFFF